MDDRTVNERSGEIRRVTNGPLTRGEQVGSYVVGPALGAGGMGHVYAAEDVKLQRPVALKVAIDATHAPALLAEGRALAAIRHPGVVSVYAMGEHRGHAYLVMERLFGRTLEARLAAGRRRGHTLGIHEALELLLAITDALAAAHRAGVAHCDLKPDNIVVIGSRVVLIDFGLFVPEVARTAPRPAAGAAEFMAPETIERRVRPGEGPLVDLYALGVIAHELLVGRTPFAAATFEETLQRHLTTTAPELHSVRPDVPRALSDLVGEILRRDPLERPTSAEEVVWRLSAVRSPSGMSAGIQPFRVLVVDDDPAIASALRRALKMAMPQLAVETETDPCAAVAEIERTPPDIVLLDLKMPRMNGIEVAMAITGMKTCGRTRIIATSEGASARDIDVLRSLGVEYFVPKDARFLARLATAINELRSA